ncbi:MAG TPA: HAD family hydrolase [Anaerolineaceae bacterium]|nr:HAD family hydrolase [Anaerolineaceae bacterium]
MSIPIITFDIDGTLLSPAERIHPADLHLLNHPPAGAVLVPNTGRPLLPVGRLLRRQGAFTGCDRLPLPAVTQNGGAIYAAGERLLDTQTLGPDLFAQILGIIHAFPRVMTMVNTADCIYALHPTPFGMDKAAGFDFTVQPYDSRDPGQRFIKVMWCSDRYDELEEMSRCAAELPAAVTSSMPFIVEVNPLGVDKATGLQRLLERLGLPNSPVYAAGDGGNDLDLLRAAARSFTPATSPAEVQAAASEVVDAAREGILTPMLRAAGVG